MGLDKIFRDGAEQSLKDSGDRVIPIFKRGGKKGK